MLCCVTGVVLHQLLHGVELGAGGDVVAPVVQFADLIVLHVVPLCVVPVSDGQGVRTWEIQRREMHLKLIKARHWC